MLKKSLFYIIMLTSSSCFNGGNNSTDPLQWDSKQIDKWFEKGEWLQGWQVKPDMSINRKTFTVSYFKNKERWDKAFAFLKNTDLSKLEAKRYDIDGENLYAQVSDYFTKNEENASYEAHRKHIDLQYIIEGKELIGLASLTNRKDILVPYDTTNDVEIMTVTGGKSLRATPANFFIFFPEDAHSPGLKDGESSHVRKIVVKVKID